MHVHAHASGTYRRLLFAQVNDVRGARAAGLGMFASGEGAAAKSTNGTAYEWYLRLSFELAERPCTPVTKLILWHPIDSSATHDPLSRYAVPSSDALFWWTLWLPRSGLLLPPGWVHSHRARCADCTLIARWLRGYCTLVARWLHAGCTLVAR